MNFRTADCQLLSDRFISNLSCVLRPDKNRINGQYIEFKLAQNLNNLSVDYSISMKRNDKWETYIRFNDFDYCLNLKSFMDNYIMRTIYEGLYKDSNLPYSCPFLKDVEYFVKNLQINSNVLPPYTPEMKFKSDSVFKTNGIRIGRGLFYGEIKRTK